MPFGLLAAETFKIFGFHYFKFERTCDDVKVIPEQRRAYLIRDSVIFTVPKKSLKISKG